MLLTRMLMVGAWQVHDWSQDARHYFQGLLQPVAADRANLLFDLEGSQLRDLVTFLARTGFDYAAVVPPGFPLPNPIPLPWPIEPDAPPAAALPAAVAPTAPPPAAAVPRQTTPGPSRLPVPSRERSPSVEVVAAPVKKSSKPRAPPKALLDPDDKKAQRRTAEQARLAAYLAPQDDDHLADPMVCARARAFTLLTSVSSAINVCPRASRNAAFPYTCATAVSARVRSTAVCSVRRKVILCPMLRVARSPLLPLLARSGPALLPNAPATRTKRTTHPFLPSVPVLPRSALRMTTNLRRNPRLESLAVPRASPSLRTLMRNSPRRPFPLLLPRRAPPLKPPRRALLLLALLALLSFLCPVLLSLRPCALWSPRPFPSRRADWFGS